MLDGEVSSKLRTRGGGGGIVHGVGAAAWDGAGEDGQEAKEGGGGGEETDAVDISESSLLPSP